MNNKFTLDNSLLVKLLNDESFIRWLDGRVSDREQKKWDKWFLENSRHRELVKKARKITTMPFVDHKPADLQKELKILEKKLNNLTKEHG